MHRLVPQHIIRGWVIAGLFGLSVMAHADTLQMPAGSPDSTSAEMAIQLPGRGMSMETVEEKFGPPIEKVEAVGTPPISRWVYHRFTVYFESDRVIHSVVNKQ